MADQLRADAISINGDPNVNTPNLHNLAMQGVNFTRAISGSPLCCPSRGCFLTGEYPHQSSVPGHEYQLSPQKKTIAELFNQAGYNTLYYGKWHLDGYKESEGRAAMHTIPRERRGKFGTWIGYENNNSQFDSYVHGHDGEEEINHYRLPKFETDALTDLVIEKLSTLGAEHRKNKMKPFFLTLSVQPPHDPYIAPSEFLSKYTHKTLTYRDNVPSYAKLREEVRNDLVGYYALIENLDWNVGRIMNALRQHNLDLDTHIMFFSDHGDMHGSHGQYRKTTPYNEAISVPLIIGGERPCKYEGRWAGTSDALVNHVDIPVTTLGLCELEIPNWMQGHNFAHYRLKHLPAGKNPDSVYLQIVEETNHHDSINKPWRGVVTQDGWKYVCTNQSEWLMFNLKEDPYELINLVHNSVYDKKRRELREKLVWWIEKTKDTFSLPL